MNRTGMRRPLAALAGAALVAATLPLTAATSAAAATPTELFFSEYIEGSSHNKAVEVYNGTGTPVDLAAAGYVLEVYFNGATTSTRFALQGTVASGDVFVFAQSRSNPDEVDDRIDAAADQTTGASLWNGDDALVLRKGAAVVDSIGQIGHDPGTQWGSGLASTADNTLRRKTDVTSGDTNPDDAFDPAGAWDGFANDSFDGLGTHEVTTGPAPDTAPEVASTVPTDGSSDFPNAGNLTVTFNEPVTAGAGAFTLSCDGDDQPLGSSDGPTTYTLDPVNDLASQAECLLTVHAENVMDQDGSADAMVADHVAGFTAADTRPVCERGYTPISEIQGSGSTAAVTGQVTTEGVVVGDFEGEQPRLRGFYIQDAAGDDEPATSDGIFVFNSTRDQVELGDLVRVSGSAGDFQGQTQIGAGSVETCDSGVSVAPTEVQLPFASEADRERYEGMLVELPQTLTVTELFQLGRFGQVTLSSGGKLAQPTNVVEPGSAAGALQAANDLNRIIVDDALNNQNPDPIAFGRDGLPLSAENSLRGGDTATGTVGVMTYTWAGNSASPNNYRVRPVGALGGHVDFEAANPRPEAPEPVGGKLQVASFNVLNYFNTLDTSRAAECQGGVAGPVVDCRGANTALELERQADKIVAALAGLDADVVGLVEIENDGYGTDSALADLTRRLNAEVGAATYRYLDVDERSGQVDALGDDAIKVAMIYKPDEVVPNGETAVLNTESFVDGGTASPKNRPALAQAFLDRDTGGRFTMVVNHFKSKGSGCGAGDDDTSGGQGNCNGTRVHAAQELADWLATYPTGIKEPDVLIMGDLNAYAQEDPVDTLREAGFTDLVQEFEGPDAYSYVFDGQWGYLDHALASSSLAPQVTGTTTWHINADEPSVLDYNTDFKSQEQVDGLYAPTPYRSSDHDPVLVGLDLTS